MTIGMYETLIWAAQDWLVVLDDLPDTDDINDILDSLGAIGYVIDGLYVTGDYTKNPILMELYGNAVGYRLTERDDDHGVLVGTTSAAATAADFYPGLERAAAAISSQGRERPSKSRNGERYEHDDAIFLAMHEHRKDLDAIAQASYPCFSTLVR